MTIRRLVLLWLILLGWGWTSPAYAQGMGIVNPVYQFLSNTGVPLASGTLNTYACGTTTNLTTYSDSALTSANANPVVLDSAGRATIYFSAACYRLILKNSAGTTIYDQDNIQQPQPWNGTTVTAKWQSLAPTTLTISGNAIVPTRNVHAVDTAGGAVNLSTLTATNVTTGFVLTLYGANPGANPVTVKTGVGNITLAGGDYALNNANRFLVLAYVGTTWYELARSAPTTVINNRLCEGRITLTTALPVTTADVLAATTVYFTPYQGNVCALYDSTAAVWNLRTFSELSVALGTDAANTPYDLWMYDNAGTPTLERLAWTNDTTRATALVLQDGVQSKSGQVSRRYLGTYRTTGTAGQTEDSEAKRFVWNYYNKVPRNLRVVEATDSWTYTTATYRQANAATANQIDMVIGIAESELTVEVRATAANTATSVNMIVAIGEDSTTAAASNEILVAAHSATANVREPATALLRKWPAIGRHFYAWLEQSAATGTSTWYGKNADATKFQSGLFAELR